MTGKDQPASQLPEGAQGESERPSFGAVRVAEVVATLSLATDLGIGQSDQWAARSAILAVRLGESLGLSDEDLADTYYLALLRYAGCTADSHVAADVFGDELAFRRDFSDVDALDMPVLLLAIVSRLAANQPFPERVRTITHALASMPRMVDSAAAHCEVARGVAARMGFGPRVQRGLDQVFERWDGSGYPHRIKGDAIELPMRVVQVSQDAETFYRFGGVDAAVAMARKRSGRAFDPRIVERFCADAARLLQFLETTAVWEAVLDAEPGPRPVLSGERIDEALRAIADFADLKSPFTTGHSSGVAHLVAAAARHCRLPASDAVVLRRAALLHDVGRVGVSSAIWIKPGPLSDLEWEKVRFYPYFTERVLSRSPFLAPLGVLASTHNERLDGSGYPRATRAAAQSLAARILAAADVYRALTERRPHRAERTPGEAADELQREARRGRLDPEAVNAVLAATGKRPSRRRPWPGELSEREVEVLRLLARGLPNREIARALTIAEKTVDHHVQHIYAKLGVSTRAAAMLFAMEHDLLG